MAQTLELLTHRTETMRGIRGIVRTMKTMSAINATPYEQAADAMRAYREVVLMAFHAFVESRGALPVVPAGKGPPIAIVLGSDHGLCGNYNEIVAGHLHEAVGDAGAARVVCVGAQMEDALTALGHVPAATLFPPASAGGLGRLAADLITLLDDMRHGAGAIAGPVSLVFMSRAPHGRQEPVRRWLLPLDRALLDDLAARGWTSRSRPMFRMPAPELLSALIRGYLFAELFRAAAEALVTENAARLARMQQAERSVEDRLQELTGELRIVRQSEITAELQDVIIGFEALKRRRAQTGTEDGEPS